ncbi:MAG TPA: tRNA-dihydrouridine synthase [Candidatus Thermoplasmatota archaeon]
MGLRRPMKIGNAQLPNNLVLSPMAGFTDMPFRVLCRKHGAGLVSSEMVAAASIHEPAIPLLRRRQTCEDERPTSIQLFGTDPENIAEAARELGPDCDVLGFNMGCPAPQIKRAGCGAALLDHPEKCEAIVRAIKRASDKPLLVKMRAGNQAAMDVVAFAKRLEEAGADALIFHARTAAQGYSGRADWSLIRLVKETLWIPLIGNGDISDGPSAYRALSESGADGIAIGRAALGDPRLFGRIAYFLEHGKPAPATTPAERADDFLTYLEGAEALGYDMPRILQQAQRFTRGLRGGAELRETFQGGRKPVGEIRAVFEGLRASAG